MAGIAKPNTRIGFAQVERNHMAGGEVEGRIHAQLPVDTAVMGTVIENGRFAKYNMVSGKVTTAGDFEWEMIYNEEMLYDERKQNHKDFALQGKDFTNGEIVPRLMAVEIGDIFTTNAIGEDTLSVSDINALTDIKEASVTMPAVDTDLYIAANGYLTETKPDSYVGPEFKVIKPFATNCTMPDGQPAVKLMRVK